MCRIERFADHARGRPFHAALAAFEGPTLMHGHRDYYEAMAVVSGNGQHHLIGPDSQPRVMPLQAGHLVLVRPQDRHYFDGNAQFYNVAFPATAWRSFLALAHLDPAGQEDPIPPHADFDDDRAVRTCLTMVHRFHAQPRELDLLDFWMNIVALLGLDSRNEATSSEIPHWLSAATAQMSEPEHLRRGVRGLRELAHVSAAHLTRSVQRYYAMTPTAFVTDLQMRHATSLLASTDRPIAEIAHTCGFASPSYFNRCFRKTHGTTPRQFRTSARTAFVPS